MAVIVVSFIIIIVNGYIVSLFNYLCLPLEKGIGV